MYSGTNMARFFIPGIEEKTTHDNSKRHQTIDRCLRWFFIDLGSVLGADFEPCWPPYSAPNGPEGLQDDSKTPPRRPKTLPKTSIKTLPNLPQSPPDLDVGAPRPGL